MAVGGGCSGVHNSGPLPVKSEADCCVLLSGFGLQWIFLKDLGKADFTKGWMVIVVDGR